MSIPGLLHVPVEESTTSEPITLTSFDLKAFTVPAAHKFGKCRPVGEFDRITTLGEGTYGTVYKVKDQKTGDILALKRLKIGKDVELIPQTFLREITNLKLMKHDNIVNLFGIAVGRHFISTYLILEYCEYSLSTVVDEVEQTLLQQPQIKNIMKQLYSGLDYIHKHFLLHRDLSVANILFNGSGCLKISDFGLSRKTPWGSGRVTPNVGGLWYKAPEILFGSENYTSAIDIWCSGCILSELLHQKPLFNGDTEYKMIVQTIDFLGTPTESLWPGYSSLPVPKSYELRLQPYNRIRSTFEAESPATISFLQKILQYNPANRPTAEQCLQHAYFSELPVACPAEVLLVTLKASVCRKI